MTEPLEWTPELDARLIELANMGGTHRSIAEAIGRSRTSVANRLAHLESQRIDANARASRYLGDCIIAAQTRFASEGGMTLAEAQRFLMGGNYAPPIPGTERHLKTCAVERMAA